MAILHSRLGQWLAGMAVLVALLALLAAAGALSPVEDAAAALFHPVQSALRRAAEPVANLVSSAGDFGALDDENRALRNRVEQLEAQVARLQEKEVRLRATDALQTVQAAQPNEIFLAAHVITRDLTGLRDIIGIDKGRSDGVQEGMPVLTDGGSLVGIVIEARAHISYVRLLTDPESSLRGRHQLSRTEGVIAADPGGTLRRGFHSPSRGGATRADLCDLWGRRPTAGGHPRGDGGLRAGVGAGAVHADPAAPNCPSGPVGNRPHSGDGPPGTDSRF